MSSPRLCRTRIVCVSDTHNSTVKLPDGDVLIHAGDLTNQGSYSELSRAVKWLENAKYEAKIIIAGNHDVTLDDDFYSDKGHHFHNQNPQSHHDCLELLTSSPSITYLNHSSATVTLSSPRGPRTRFTIFGSPYSPRCGLWAFSYDSPASTATSAIGVASLWSDIPLATDIVVTHTPPRTHRDASPDGTPAGCEALRRALWRVRPRLAVCGHVHNGRGAERITWDLDSRDAEVCVSPWEDPAPGAGGKLSLVDLTGRRAPSLANDGGHAAASPPWPSAGLLGVGIEAKSHDPRRAGTIGLGSDPATEGRDVDALEGRSGRRETCVVNAAIVKTNYPHFGGKQLNKPIIVDLDLPVWEEG